MSRAILLAVTSWDPKEWDQRFRALAPGRDIRLWPDRIGNRSEIVHACAWKPPSGLLATFPCLEVIFSLGAGVDHLLTDPSLPRVPVVRIVDPDLTRRMSEYVALHVLMLHRRVRLYDAQQRERVWHDHHQPAAGEVTVGIMGLGVMGRDAVEVLVRLGFRVVGWSRTAKIIPGVETFCGSDGLPEFLARSEILVCLLPHTRDTERILNLATFRRMRRDGALGGAYLINAGRGALQVDADILAALDQGLLAGATLDVFPTEPLPKESALWAHPAVTVTPHNAAESDPRVLVAKVLDQIDRHERGLPLDNVVDRAAGY
jgi:glyoxylate/hydroxypyruvate reductase A